MWWRLEKELTQTPRSPRWRISFSFSNFDLLWKRPSNKWKTLFFQSVLLNDIVHVQQNSVVASFFCVYIFLKYVHTSALFASFSFILFSFSLQTKTKIQYAPCVDVKSFSNCLPTHRHKNHTDTYAKKKYYSCFIGFCVLCIFLFITYYGRNRVSVAKASNWIIYFRPSTSPSILQNG